MKKENPRTELIQKKKDKSIRLTQFTTGGGCACKLRPQDLEKVLIQLPVFQNEQVLVGPATHDDAAVYQIDEETALVNTVDFFTPIVDDPYWFGAIAAANALSDIYAMGAQPLFALNIVGFPSDKLAMDILKEILTGAQEKCKEAGIPILGGHTIDDEDPKYGLAVTGKVHPAKILTNNTARPGDMIILTKPLGTGIISSGIKKSLVPAGIEEMITRQMAALNKKGADIMKHYPVSSCTDVTGFGLLGHLGEMTQGSHVDALIRYADVPVLPLTEQLAGNGVIPAGTRNNLNYTSPFVSYADSVSELQKLILNDAQTSGGLLIAIPEKYARNLLNSFLQENIKAQIIGKIIKSGKGKIYVR